MGFLGPIPADQVTATYIIAEHVLRLQATGTVLAATSGIKFDRQALPGGLKFVLEGWTGPLTGDTETYNVELSFNITLPSLATPSDSIIVVTANYPEGLTVPIQFDGPIIPPTPSGQTPPQAPPQKAVRAATPAATDPTPGPVVTLSEEELLNALFKTTFKIKEQASVPSTGSVKIKFDDQFLTLLSAGIDNQNIVWSFTSLKEGTTQVVVTVNGGIAQFIQIKTYTVHIFTPLRGNGKPLPVIEPDTATTAAAGK